MSEADTEEASFVSAWRRKSRRKSNHKGGHKGSKLLVARIEDLVGQWPKFHLVSSGKARVCIPSY